MCLGVPGRILSMETRADSMTMGRVSFAGVIKEVCLDFTPEAAVGDYVVVHVGFAISRVDEAEAQEVFRFLAQMDDLGELAIEQPQETPAP